jgi:hypothetical protein
VATSTTRLGIRRVTGTDLFKPYTIDLPSIVDTIDAKAVQFRSALASVQVRDVGEVGQIRAGRVLAPADFTRMGLAAPLGLWNLGDVNDASGAGRTLTNKGAVPFGPGIMGAATEAAIFAGSTGQALYIADTGAADPFRIKTGSWGSWFRTAKRGTTQVFLSKLGATAAVSAFQAYVFGTGNVVGFDISNGTIYAGTGVGSSDVADDRWHFAVVTFDGTKSRLYVDGALEAQQIPATAFTINSAASAPLNVGGSGADAGAATVNAFYGRVDEAFVTADVLSPEQVLNLYCARVAHTLADGAGTALAPTGARIGWRRRKRGGVLATTDFPATPVRLHNFTAGAFTEASGGVALAPVGGGTIVTVAAPDGVRDGAYSFSGAHTGLGASDTSGVGGATNSLPAAFAARSYGVWLKTTSTAVVGVLAWGTTGTADARLVMGASGIITTTSGADAINGPVVADGLWHFVVAVEDNAAADGVKRKLYLDGRLVGGSTVMNTLTLAGANRFRVGANPDGTAPFVGQADAAFVSAVALTAEQVRALYNVGSLALASSPKAEGDHVEALEQSGVLARFDALEGCDLVDLSVVG